MKIEKNKSLLKYNTFGIDATCKEFISIENEKELEDINFDEKKLILGGGSNILISKPIPQVIYLATKGIEKVDEDADNIYIQVKSGEIWDDLVEFCVKNNYSGVENLSLIPGTVGAAPIQNIGAYGVEVADLIEKVTYFDIETKKFKNLSQAECKFDYRNSIFKQDLKGKAIITEILLKLKKIPDLKISYGGLSSFFYEGEEIGIKNIREAVISIRKNKLPNYHLLGNAGSFFKNAIINETKFHILSDKYPDLKYFKVNKGYKIPTAWLIDKAGLKGYRRKNVGVYSNHALILINYGGAKAQDILDLADYIENKLENKFGIKILKEVNII